MKKNELLSKVLDDLKSDNIKIQKRELEIIYNRIFSKQKQEKLSLSMFFLILMT